MKSQKSANRLLVETTPFWIEVSFLIEVYGIGVSKIKVGFYKYHRLSRKHRLAVNYAFGKSRDLCGGNRMFDVRCLEGVRGCGISTFASYQLLIEHPFALHE